MIIEATTKILETGTGVVVLMPARGIVVKCVHKEYDDEWGLFNREYHILGELYGNYLFPLIWTESGYGVLIMNYCGEPLTRENVPNDLERQLEQILTVLKKYQICHNDIQPNNLMVKDARIKLIDFGWATKKGEPIPENWPKVLGGEFKGDNGFSDEESVKKVIKHIRGDMRINETLSTGLRIDRGKRDLDYSINEVLKRHSKPKTTLSVCMIVRDEEENLKELLPQLTFADEVVLVDTRPKDEEVKGSEYTWTFAYGITPKIEYFPWNDSFADARNFAKSKCTMDTILWLDADDRLPQKTIDILTKELESGKGKQTLHYFDVIMTHDGKPNGNRVSQPRLFPNIPEIKWTGRVHETLEQSIPASQKRVVTDLEIHHTGYEDLELMRKKNARNKILLEMELGSPKKYKELADCYGTLGKLNNDKDAYISAISYLEIALKYPDLEEGFKNHLFFRMGMNYTYLGVFEMALAYFQKSGKQDAKYGEADALYSLGKRDEALKTFLEYLDMEPIHDFHGSIFLVLRDNAYKMVMRILKEKYEKEYAPEKPTILPAA